MTPEYVTKDSIFDIVFGEFCACSDETEQVLNNIIEQVRALSDTDVAPVIHGKWSEKIDPWDRQHIGKCSECGKRYSDYIYFRFCPNCGVKMDKGEE